MPMSTNHSSKTSLNNQQTGVSGNRRQSMPTLEAVSQAAQDLTTQDDAFRGEPGSDQQPLARVVYDVEQRPPFRQMLPLGLQHLFAMFGATVLVPLLTHMDPSVALFTAGAGTLLFILITQGRVPAYLGSSFAFIAPITVISQKYGLPYALGGTVAVGLLYAVVALIIRLIGIGWLERVLPPVVVGPVVIVIGLGLAAVAVQNAGLSTATVSLTNVNVQIALFTLVVTAAATGFFRGFLGIIPILVGVVGGYLFAILRGAVDFTPVQQAPWLGLPAFVMPAWSWAAIATMLPVSIVTLAEHIGHILVLNNVTSRDFLRDPGLHRTILGDGLATSLAGFLGGPPNTTYGENIGVMAITRVYSVWVIGAAAVMAIALAFIGKVGALLQTIPNPVMGGITIVLFGTIAAAGLRNLVENGVDFSRKRNLVIASVILVLGIGGAKLTLGSVHLEGMAVAALAGVLLNLIMPGEKSQAQMQVRHGGGGDQPTPPSRTAYRGVAIAK